MTQTFITWNVKKYIQNSGLVEQTFNLSTWEIHLVQVWGQPGQHSKLQPNNGYMMITFTKTQRTKIIYKCKMSAEKNIFFKSKISHGTGRTLWKDE